MNAPDEGWPGWPVRQRVIMDIIPGTYGRAIVRPGGCGDLLISWSDEKHGWTSCELRSAARLLNSLAEALEHEQ